MRRFSVILIALASVSLYACGATSLPPRQMTARQALTQSPEVLDFETSTRRVEMFREIARSSQTEAGQRGKDAVLFPILVDGDLVAAPGFDPQKDLLQAPNAGAQIRFDDAASDRWSDERTDLLGGLSEREAAELVSRSLVALWDVHTDAAIQVDRATGAPYAALYMDGHLRVNPAFVYLAATPNAQ